MKLDQDKPVTLDDIKELNAPVRAHCERCSHTAYIPTDAMPGDTVVIHIARQLRCSRCRSPQVVTRPCYEHMVPPNTQG